MNRELFEKACEIDRDILSLKCIHERCNSCLKAIENDNFKLEIDSVWGSMFFLEDNYVHEELKAALKSILKQKLAQIEDEIAQLGEQFEKI